MSGWRDSEGGLPSIDDLTTGPERDPRELIDQARRELGIDVLRARYPRPGYQPPDVSGLRQRLGIE
jgi:hypothetical protein